MLTSQSSACAQPCAVRPATVWFPFHDLECLLCACACRWVLGWFFAEILFPCSCLNTALYCLCPPPPNLESVYMGPFKYKFHMLSDLISLYMYVAQRMYSIEMYSKKNKGNSDQIQVFCQEMEWSSWREQFFSTRKISTRQFYFLDNKTWNWSPLSVFFELYDGSHPTNMKCAVHSATWK